MVQESSDLPTPIPGWHRNLLIAAALFTILLIAMGGILCVTQSIRNCPDWPGCFGSFIPPSGAGPLLEYTHRLLAVISGLLVLAASIAGVSRARRVRWISLPPLVALGLLLLVSFFGAQVVLHGLAPGWAAVDVGSALLVVALMVYTATIAYVRQNAPDNHIKLKINHPFARLVSATAVVVYLVLVSGILVAGKGSLTACLGWPVYSLVLFKSDGHFIGNLLRTILSVAGFVMLIMVLVQAWSRKYDQPSIFNIARWLGAIILLEGILQLITLAFGMRVPVLIGYTVTAAVFWAVLVTLMARVSLLDTPA